MSMELEVITGTFKGFSWQLIAEKGRGLFGRTQLRVRGAARRTNCFVATPSKYAQSWGIHRRSSAPVLRQSSTLAIPSSQDAPRALEYAPESVIDPQSRWEKAPENSCLTSPGIVCVAMTLHSWAAIVCRRRVSASSLQYLQFSRMKTDEYGTVRLVFRIRT